MKFSFLTMLAASVKGENMLQGINWLGSGYNVVFGNPSAGVSNGAAPEGLIQGQQIFAFTEDEDTSHGLEWPTGSGDKKTCALGVQCFPPVNSCSSDMSSTTSHGAKSMQDNLALSISAGGGVPLVGSFTLSTNFHLSVSQMEEHDYHFISTEATCSLYGFKMHDVKYSDDLKLTQDFLNAVGTLSSDGNLTSDDAFYELIEAFGTHYTTAATIGGQYLNTTWFTSDAWQHSLDIGISLEAQAQVSFKVATGGIDSKSEAAHTCTETYESTQEGNKAYYMGGAAFPESGQVSEWYQGLVDNDNSSPVGKGMEIAPITDIFIEKFFPDDDLIKEKADRMKELLPKYCAFLNTEGKKCIEAPEDVPDLHSIEQLDTLITAASGGEEFTVSAGTYTRTMEGSDGHTYGIVIEGKAMTIVGEGSDSSILDGGNDHHVVEVYDVSSGKVVFDGLAVKNGYDSSIGGMLISNSDVEMSNMLIEKNTADGRCGGVYLYNSGTLLMVRCIVRSNTASFWGDGGGLFVYNGEVTLLGNTFESNTATHSGDDIYNYNGTVTVHGCPDGYDEIKGAALDTVGPIEGEPFSYTCTAAGLV